MNNKYNIVEKQYPEWVMIVKLYVTTENVDNKMKP